MQHQHALKKKDMQKCENIGTHLVESTPQPPELPASLFEFVCLLGMPSNDVEASTRP